MSGLGALGRFCLLRGGGVQLRRWLAVMVLARAATTARAQGDAFPPAKSERHAQGSNVHTNY